jgi:intracellular multiplication protein IcmV
MLGVTSMGVKDIIKISRKTYFNPVGWFGSDAKYGAQVIIRLAKGLFAVPEAHRAETFQQAVARFQLTTDDIKKIQQRYYLFFLIFSVLAIIMLFYGFYLLFYQHHFLGWMLSIAVTGLFAAQAFRYHFWRFQIKHRKLGCTLQEWWQGKLATDQDHP